MKTLRLYIEYWGTRLFYITVLFLICYGSYCYSVPEFSIGGHVFKSLLYHDHHNLATWLYYVEYFICIFIILAFLIFALTIYYGQDKKRKEKTHNRYINFYISYLLAFIFSKNGLPEEEIKIKKKKLRKFVRNDYSRELVINTLQQIHHQTIGQIRDDAEQLLHELKYDYLIQSYLYSPYYRHKRIALNTISEFKIHGYENYILRLAKHGRNKLLHTDALVALIHLNPSENLLLMIKRKVNISMWEVNVIINNIEKDNIREIPYDGLIHSDNKGMILLGIILSRLHRKKELKDDIRNFIPYPNDTISEEAILAFGAFAEDEPDFKYLGNAYSNATGRGKLSIISTITYSPDAEYAMQFLEWVAVNEPIKYKTEALKFLLTINMERVAKLQSSEDPLVTMACKEVLDINL